MNPVTENMARATTAIGGRNMRVSALAVLFSLLLLGCATTNLDRVEPSEIESIEARVYDGASTTSTLVPDKMYRVATGFRLSGDSEYREDELSRGVEVSSDSLVSRRSQEGLMVQLPLSAALAVDEAHVDFSRAFGDADEATTIEWSATFGVRWPRTAEWNFDARAGADAADLVVEIAFYDTEDVPSAPGSRMIIAHVAPRSGGRGRVYLFPPNGVLTVTARGGTGRKGQDGSMASVLFAPGPTSQRPLTGDFVSGDPGQPGGNGGDGGDIEIVTPDGATELTQSIIARTDGGAGGRGGSGGRSARLTLMDSGNYFYVREGQAAPGPSGRPGANGTILQREQALESMFNGLEGVSWLDRTRLRVQ